MKPHMRAPVTCWMALLALSAGCSRQHDGDDFLPTAPAVAGALIIEISSSSIPADNHSTTTLVAKVDPSADFRKIVFETNRGTFLGADPNSSDQRKTVEADITGQAEAQLKAGTKAGRAVITVEVRGVDGDDSDAVLITKTVFVEMSRPDADTLVLTLSDTSLAADGFSFVELLAEVAADAPPELKEIVFETTLGKFAGATEQSGRKLEKPADINGQAPARLTSDSNLTTGVAEVTVSLKNLPEVVKRRLVEFLPVSDEFIKLSVSAPSIPADGFSEVELTAEIDPETPPSLREVTFTSTGGSFPQSSSETTIDVTADLEGRAVTRLRSDTDVGTVEVTAFRKDLPAATAKVFVEFTPVDPDEIIKLSVSSPTAPADGATLTDLIAEIAPHLTGENRKVTFGGAVLGKLSTTSATADASNRAVVRVTSAGVLGTDRLTATVNASSGNTPVTADTDLEYVRALPDSLTLKADSAVMSATADSLDFTATVRRQIGKVTPGTTVDYDIRKQSDNTPVDFIFQSATLTDSNGESEATLVRGGSTFTGFAIVRATVPGSGASDEVVIEIK